jgi:hypothetical protein
MVLMPSDLLDAFKSIPWGLWLPIGVGVVATAVTLLLGRNFFASAAGQTAKPSQKLDPTTDPFRAGATPELRAVLRRSGNDVAVFVTDPQKPGEPERAYVVDRSQGGLGLGMDLPVAVGTILRVRPCDAQVTTPWTEVQVRTCRKEELQWKVGCSFVQTPSFDVLLLFG